MNPDLTLPGHPEVFVVGDMIALNNLPGRRPGGHPGREVRRQGDQGPAARARRPQKPFKYFDKGSMATISRFDAVAMVGKLRLSGFIAWLMWLGVHLIYLTGFKNQVDRAAALDGHVPEQRPLRADRHRAADLRPRRR